jgi:hypothetical protein
MLTLHAELQFTTMRLWAVSAPTYFPGPAVISLHAACSLVNGAVITSLLFRHSLLDHDLSRRDYAPRPRTYFGAALLQTDYGLSGTRRYPHDDRGVTWPALSVLVFDIHNEQPDDSRS